MARVLAARRHLHQRICATMPNGYMGRDFAVNFLKAHEAMDALKFNLRQEHIVIYDFVSNFHQARLTPEPGVARAEPLHDAELAKIRLTRARTDSARPRRS